MFRDLSEDVTRDEKKTQSENYYVEKGVSFGPKRVEAKIVTLCRNRLIRLQLLEPKRESSDSSKPFEVIHMGIVISRDRFNE